jgi:hypothetical protein
MSDRLFRGLMLFAFSATFYYFLTCELVLSVLYPQLQVGLIGLVKASVGATVGYLVGLALFPHKINWGSRLSVIGLGGYARVLLTLFFSFVGYSYA